MLGFFFRFTFRSHAIRVVFSLDYVTQLLLIEDSWIVSVDQ